LSLYRQGRHFAIIGLLQWLADWGAMVALSYLGMPIAPANVAGRICGAALGFWLNGTITFARADSRHGWRAFLRYACVWTCLALLSTLLVAGAGKRFGLGGAWLGKPLIDAVLSLASFLAMRCWVYR